MRIGRSRHGGFVTLLGSTVAVAATVHSIWNLRLLRRPSRGPVWVQEDVAVLLPLRNEAHRVEPCLSALRSQHGLPRLRIWVLDDESTDGTRDVVRRIAGDDPRVTLLPGAPVPAGWWGKPWACQQLADAARAASVLVFVDADVVLAPEGVAASVSLLRNEELQLVSPYPRQLAVSVAERLVQPLLQWSWLTMLPLRVAERSARPSLTAANGQLLVVDRAVYERAGGHAAVRADLLDDIAFARAVKRSGGRVAVADGTELATCRMYAGWPALRDGHAKSLWSAFGSPVGAAGVVGGLVVVYVVPPLAALRGSRVGAVGYLAAVAGRLMVARRVRARLWPDALAHPVSVLVLGWLTWVSWWRRTRGSLTVAGRAVP